MDIQDLLGIGIALAMDAFATAAVVMAGLKTNTIHHTFRLTWHFGLFQAVMPVFGWWGGMALSSFTNQFARIIATVILIMIGVKMIWDAGESVKEKKSFDPTRGWSLVALSLATSMDALATGISIGIMGESIWVASLVIGSVTFLLTYVGVQVGKRAGTLLGPWAERVGGAVLIVVGARVVAFG